MPDELLAFLRALEWAALALILGAAIFGTFYWIDTARGERAARKRHFGGV